MSYSANISIFAVLLFGVILVPGMDMLYVVTNTLTNGIRAGIAAVAGITAGGVVHTIWGGLSVGLLLAISPSVLTAVLFAGATYMAWIGFTLVRSSIRLNTDGTAVGRTPAVAFRQGAVTCLLNPKAYLFVFSVYPQFVKPEFGPIVLQVAVMGAMTAVMQTGVYAVMALGAGRVRQAMADNPRATVIVGRVAGALFVLVAIVTVWQGLKALD